MRIVAAFFVALVLSVAGFCVALHAGSRQGSESTRFLPSTALTMPGTPSRLPGTIGRGSMIAGRRVPTTPRDSSGFGNCGKTSTAPAGKLNTK